ncbi:hypothetical protein THAOC_17367, partial [Thalassiosira oceanica]
IEDIEEVALMAPMAIKGNGLAGNNGNGLNEDRAAASAERAECQAGKTRRGRLTPDQR